MYFPGTDMTIRLCFFVLLFVQTSFASTIPCPFNPIDCTCVDPVSEAIFTRASCQSRNGQIPQFTGTPGLYTINGEFNLTFNAYMIPDYAFQPFGQILQLNLIQPPGPNVSVQAWQPHAFAGPRVSVLQITNLAGVIPPPAPLRDIAEGLLSIRYINCTKPVVLSANVFSSLIKLEEIRIQDTFIAIVDDAAFAGLENTLKTIAFRNTGLIQFPSRAFNRLSNVLDTLDLSDNGIGGQSQTADFEELSKLTSLCLNGNDIQTAVDSGVLSNLPVSLRYLYLESGRKPLKTIPISVLQNLTERCYLSLARNQIAALRLGDFPDGSKVGDLNLEGNPISSIDYGALMSMDSVQSLTLNDTKLTSFDLWFTYGMNGLWYLFLDQNRYLKTLTSSYFDAVRFAISDTRVATLGIRKWALAKPMMLIAELQQF